LAGAFLVSLYAVWKSRGQTAALWWSFSPVLLVYGVLNWDLLGIMMWGMGLWAYRRGQLGRAGLWIGLGTVTKFFPIVLVPYLLAEIFLREAKGRHQGSKRFLGGFALTAIGINLPFALFARAGWSVFYTYNTNRPPTPGIYQWLCQQGWVSLGQINLLSAVLTVLGGMALLFLVWKKRLGAIEAGTAALAWWFLWNKVYSPQYIMWVIYALVWTPIDPPLLIIANIVGLFDFAFSFHWLAMGTASSPFYTQFVSHIVPPFLFLLNFTLVWVAVIRPWTLRHKQTPLPAESLEDGT
ncbi:MAG: glycosyltransferase 87 family protein, partial [Firmicutes bacterium]|nr:glycosyltransferase 87 family protein [Bacillota bacterium]